MTKENTTIRGLYEMYLLMGDPRVANWPMMDTPMKTIVCLILYVITLHFIREHMQHRKPFDLKYVLIVYNFAQVIGSFYIFAEVDSKCSNLVLLTNFFLFLAFNCCL